jgi:hypothetical protein
MRAMICGVLGILAIRTIACGSGGSSSGSDAGSGGGSGGGSGSSSGSSGGSSGGEAGAACDAAGAGEAGRRCTLSMPVTGGLTGTLDGETGCGDGSGADGSLTWDSMALGARVTANFETALPDQPGTYPLTSLEISVMGPDGGMESWTTPSGACSVTITMADIECQVAFETLLHVVYGTGTCSQPAAPDGGNASASVNVGDFQFEHWL